MSDPVARHFFESLPWPVWVVGSEHGRLTDMNGQARGLLRQGRYVRLLGERLLPAIGSAERGWREALGTVSRRARSCATAPVERLGMHHFVFTAIGGPGEPAESVAITLAGRPASGVQTHALDLAFGLTPAETRLLGLLAEGRTLMQACAHLGVQLTTARTQLRGIFSKTGTHRQADLLLLVKAFPPLADCETAAAAAQAPHASPARPGGRAVSPWRRGRPDGAVQPAGR